VSATVLVVEDEADVMLTFRIVLQTAGYQVVEASTGEEALTILDTLVPDAMILDLLLPGIDGWQVLAAIRKAGHLAQTPIIVASANAHPDQRTRAEKFGCGAVFTKPFSAEQLRLTLTTALALSAPPD
jgi:CheY-like chemotaxis protein